MKRTKAWDVGIVRDARHTTVRHRNRRIVVGLTTLTVGLLTASLFIDRRFASLPLTITCYAAAAVSGAALVAYLYNKRMRVTRPPRG
jgi:hypothetical protein